MDFEDLVYPKQHMLSKIIISGLKTKLIEAIVWKSNIKFTGVPGISNLNCGLLLPFGSDLSELIAESRDLIKFNRTTKEICCLQC
jgi:hypothetical protein